MSLILTSINDIDRESPCSSPKSSDYQASDESDHSSPASPIPGAAVQTRSTPVKRRPISDSSDSTDDDKHGSVKLKLSDLLGSNGDSDIEKRQCLLGEYKTFFERCSEPGSNDEYLLPEIVVEKEVRIHKGQRRLDTRHQTSPKSHVHQHAMY
jgi:hypothetical protein